MSEDKLTVGSVVFGGTFTNAEKPLDFTLEMVEQAKARTKRFMEQSFQEELATRLGIPQDNVTVDNVVALMEALKAIKRHQEIIGGTMGKMTGTYAIADKALAPFTPKEEKSNAPE